MRMVYRTVVVVQYPENNFHNTVVMEMIWMMQRIVLIICMFIIIIIFEFLNLVFIRLNFVTAMSLVLATIFFTMWHRQGH